MKNIKSLPKKYHDDVYTIFGLTEATIAILIQIRKRIDGIKDKKLRREMDQVLIESIYEFIDIDLEVGSEVNKKE
jgi:hypothetical protein